MIKTDMLKLTVVFVITLLTLSSVAMAQSRKAVQRPRHPPAITDGQHLSPEAARMKEMQKYWPNVPLCDEGGYRIRPCGLGSKD
jgi:hypothetical protein